MRFSRDVGGEEVRSQVIRQDTKGKKGGKERITSVTREETVGVTVVESDGFGPLRSFKGEFRVETA